MSDAQLVPATLETNPLVPVPPAALEALERAQIDTMIATAKRYPRPDIAKIRQRMLSLACIDEETAESCMYTLKRREKETGKDVLIQGPSVRLSEILTYCWQNIRFGSRTIDNDGRKVTAQGFCFDLEANVAASADASRSIVGKTGRQYSEEMQIVTAQAACSIARRNAVFQVVPFALVKPVYEEIKQVVTGNVSTLASKREKLLKRFYGMGVDQQKILEVIGKESVDAIDLEDIATLVGLGTAIKDKELTIEEAFNLHETSEGEQAPAKLTLKELAHQRAERRDAERKESERQEALANKEPRK